MRRLFRLLLMTVSISCLFMACASDNNSVKEESPIVTEETLEEEPVADYGTLSISNLEVLGYDNDPLAAYTLGCLYEYGTDTVNQNFSKAMEWYERAAELDYADAVCALGYFFLTGTEVEADYDQAIVYFEAAEALGSTNALVGKARAMFAQLVEAGDIDYYLEANSVGDESDSNDEDEASEESTDERYDSIVESLDSIVALTREARVAGDLDAAYYLGYLYENGYGLVKDMSVAKTCYLVAAGSDSIRIEDQLAINSANVAMGLMTMNDIAAGSDGVDYELAMNYFLKASDNNYAPAQYYIGQIYENGIGVNRDYEKAVEYYLLAADSEYAPALNQLGYLYYHGYGVDVDFASAVYYQKLAALQGYAPAQVNLGYLYEYGHGVELNLSTALSYYEMAAKSGFTGANEAVIRVRAQMNEEN